MVIKDPTNPDRELSREWKRFIALAKGMKNGTLRSVRIRNGNPVIGERVAKQIRFDDEGPDDLKKFETIFL